MVRKLPLYLLSAACMMKCQASLLSGMYNDVSHSIQKRFELIEQNHIIRPHQFAIKGFSSIQIS